MHEPGSNTSYSGAGKHANADAQYPENTDEKKPEASAKQRPDYRASASKPERSFLSLNEALNNNTPERRQLSLVFLVHLQVRVEVAAGRSVRHDARAATG